jgi:hypothetical protein
MQAAIIIGLVMLVIFGGMGAVVFVMLKKLDPNTNVVAVVQYMEGEKVQVTHVSITASILAEALAKDSQRTSEEIARLEAEFARI